MPEPRRRGTGTITKIAIATVVLILAITAALQLRGGNTETDALLARARNEAQKPIDVIVAAAQSRRLVFLADVPSASSPKELAVQVIERLAAGSGLDIVALEIDAAEQPYIDRYLSTPSEDASIIMARPRLTHEAEGVSRAYIDVLRAVRRMNDSLGADQQIRILALDLQDWPPAGAASPSEAARAFGQRDSAMFASVTAALDADPKTRMFFFVGGLHALKAGTGVIQTGGTKTVETEWLASRLAKIYAQDVYSILVDATPSRIPSAAVASYRGTQAGPILRDAGIKTGTALTIDNAFDFASRPITVVEKPGIHFELMPLDLKMAGLADAYIYLGS